MARLPAKERMAMSVALLASLAFVMAAVFVYRVPAQRVFIYLLMTLALLLMVMLLAAALVGLKVLIHRWRDK